MKNHAANDSCVSYRSLRSIRNIAVNTFIMLHRQLHNDRLTGATAARYRPVSQPMRSHSSTGVLLGVVALFLLLYVRTYVLQYTTASTTCVLLCTRSFSRALQINKVVVVV